MKKLVVRILLLLIVPIFIWDGIDWQRWRRWFKNGAI